MSDSFYRSFEERNRGSRSLIKSRLAAYLPFIEPLILRDQPASAIDLGCGRGEWLEMLREAGLDACGVDLDEGMLAGCRDHGLNARHADALQALRELPSGSMALVSAFHVVEHIPFDDVRSLIREALRVLQPGGLLILETPNPENLAVGTSLFYLDPSHLRPIPPQLLSFVVEHEGFHRHVVARLQEPPELHTDIKIGIDSVLIGVSPDYGVVAQKNAAPELLSAFDQPFGASYGITLAAIAQRYEAQVEKRTAESAASTASWIAYAENRLSQGDDRFHYLENRDSHLETRTERLESWLTQMENRLAQAEHQATQLECRAVESEARAAQLGEQLLATLNSRSWRVTAWLRWLGTQVTLLRQVGLIARLKVLVKRIARYTVGKGIAYVNVRPRLRQRCVNLLRHTGLYTALRPLYFRISGQRQAKDNSTQDDVPAAPATAAELPPRALKIYRKLKAAVERSKESS